jgi:hypothetical protein
MSSKEKSRMDKSVKRRERESPARKVPAKKRRTRVLSSSSSSSSGSDVVTISSSDDFFLSSSSEDEAVAEVKIIDEEEKQLRMLGEQREKHKERYKALQEAVRVHGLENLLQKARAYTAAHRAA